VTAPASQKPHILTQAEARAMERRKLANPPFLTPEPIGAAPVDEQPHSPRQLARLQPADRRYLDQSLVQAEALPLDQRLDVFRYTGSYYQAINGQLRSGTAPSDGRIVRSLDASIGASTLSHKMHLYRFARGDSAVDSLSNATSPTGTHVVEDPGFQSTSMSEPWAHWFTKRETSGVLYAIDAPAGTHGLATSAISLSPYEREVVLPRGTKLQVTATRKLRDNLIYARARIVDSALKQGNEIEQES
jgi:hypothetical protein